MNGLRCRSCSKAMDAHNGCWYCGPSSVGESAADRKAVMGL
ncbi:MAG: hypothetical protein ABH879_03110 [archaeon]